MTDYAAVLTRNYPGAEWSLNGDDYSGLTWLSNSPKPTQAELDAKWPEVQAALVLSDIQQARAARYAVEADPLFFKWQRGEGTEADWLAAVEQIRTDLPYPA